MLCVKLLLFFLLVKIAVKVKMKVMSQTSLQHQRAAMTVSRLMKAVVLLVTAAVVVLKAVQMNLSVTKNQ